MRNAVASSSREDAHDGLSAVAHGTLLVALSAFCLVLLTFFARVLLVRSPLADWNSFALELTFASILGTIGTLGLPNAVARCIPYARSDAERRAITRAALAVTGATSVTIGVAIWVIAPAVAGRLGIPNLAIGLDFFAIAIGTALIAGIIASIFRGYSNVIPNAVFLQVLNPALFLGLLLGALSIRRIGLTYDVALTAYAAANAVTLGVVVLYALLRLPHGTPTGPPPPDSLRRLMVFTAPLFVSAVTLTLAGTGDTLVLGLVHPPEVGVYAASLTLARLVVVGVASAAYIYLPVASGLLRRQNPRAVRLIYATITKWLMTLSVPALLLFLILPGQTLLLVYGPGYTAVTLPLRLTVAGAFAGTLLGPASAAQIAFGHVRLVALNSAITGIVDVGLALALAPPYGYVGAAISWAISTFLFTALCALELTLMGEMEFLDRRLGVPVAVTLGSCGTALYLWRGVIPFWALPALGLVVIAVFVIVVLGLQSLDSGDRLLLEVVERRLGRKIPLVRRLAVLFGARGIQDEHTIRP